MAMRRIRAALWTVVCVLLWMVVAGCGRTEGSVLNDLRNLRDSLKHYRSVAVMNVKTQGLEQVYHIETWYQAPSYYRIQLADSRGQVQQVVIRNDQGIYIVSPPLKKSFRFNGDWADNQGHLYLFGSVIDRILQSPSRTYTREKGTVTFDLTMKPDNPLIGKQRVILDDRTLYPKQIAFFDRQGRELVTVQFQQFDPGATFKSSDFDPQQALALGPKDEPTWASGPFGVIEPTWLPQGWSRTEVQDSGGTVILRYRGGAEGLTLTEAHPIRTETALPGRAELWDLFGVPAVVTEGNVRTMYWTRDGVQFAMTGSLPPEDMARIAISTFEASGK
ncbi:LolA family protein [Kyrpidia tusciae]|uniref:Outer membrane lipoprotein-sorting protein-like protein n=1 Tax=Kyrpidia tusciae (strain DSM 2912 / NBRC 15312 / T2) TaxID=562970 RepID=D5WSA4_KYRT2|nr:outer membrane lipoprotein carrier protein LolA [Kyrpidia tusciae]ADG04989.1 outer membrane lipoprotein-sorting protein-like protein [Kyrpidia tusciae DSM 2912]